MKKGKSNNYKKRIIPFLLSFILLWIIIGIYLLNHQTVEDKLKKKGYPSNEILEIKNILTEKDFNVLLNYSYHEKIIHIIKEEEFLSKNLKKYLDFFFQYKTADTYDIVFLINHGKENITYTPDIYDILHSKNFKEENLDRYLSYYEEYESAGSRVVIAVNHNLDEEDIGVDDTIFLFMEKEYALTRNLNRYKSYYQEHKDLEIDEVIARVNSNLDKTFYQDVNPTDLGKENLLIVNKFYYVEDDYVPDNLVTISSIYGRGEIKEEAYNAFIKMYNDAKKENLHLFIASPYRSYKRQNELYTNYSNKDGVQNADTYSARPGYSEHQTGLAMDLGTTSNQNIGDFEKSKEFKWTKENAHKYGFILRYPKGKEYITGYIYEPLHYRYVGLEAANYIYEHNITYEEYYEYFVK